MREAEGRNVIRYIKSYLKFHPQVIYLYINVHRKYNPLQSSESINQLENKMVWKLTGIRAKVFCMEFHVN